MELDRKLKGMLLPDLRQELRSRGLSPAGSIETLRDRLKESLQQPYRVSAPYDRSSDVDAASIPEAVAAVRHEEAAAADGSDASMLNVLGDSHQAVGYFKNNYNRPEGQNVSKQPTPLAAVTTP